MVTTAGGTRLLTGSNMFSTDGPLGRSPCSPSAPPHPNILQTGPLAAAQLEANDIFDVDVFTDKAARTKRAPRRDGGLDWAGNMI